jgi:carbon monoxide dehydrogenase subunit G
MKLREEFHVPESVATVWAFFEQPESVARCMPGVEEITVLDPDNVNIRATQSIGPMSATFEAKIKIVERVPEKLIRFTASGRSVRGAMGNIRAANVVELEPASEGTRVTVEGEVSLAGALGAVGQKVVAKQTNKVTAQFAQNLATMLGGGQLGTGAAAPRDGSPEAVTTRAGVSAAGAEPDRWPRIAAAASIASALLSLAVLIRLWRRPR